MLRTLCLWPFLAIALAEPKALAEGTLESDEAPVEDVQTGPEREKKPSEVNASQTYNRALELRKAKKLKEAFQLLKVLAKDEAEKARAYLLIGTMYHQARKYKKAKRFFDEAGDEIILTRDTAFAYGATYLEYDDLSRALKGLRAALKLKSGNQNQARYKLAVSYFKLGQYYRAESYFERVNPKSLSTAMRLERQRYLLDIRARQDEFMSSFTGQESEVRTVSSSPRAFDSSVGDSDWTSMAKEEEWGIRWKPLFMLHQESNQSLNKGSGRDASELLSHRFGTRAYTGGNSSMKSFGSLEFGFGLAGFEVQREQSLSFEIPGASGEFLSQKKSERTEENLYLNFQPLMNLELSTAFRGEVGLGVTAFLPHALVAKGWGQSEAFLRIRGESSEFDGGLELAAQKPYDTLAQEQSVDLIVKGDVNQRLGQLSLRLAAQNWHVGNDDFTSFSRERMSLTDARFKYRVGFTSESKISLSGSLSLGDWGLRAIYDYTMRSMPGGIERLSALDDPETVAEQADKLMFTAAYPLWDTVSLSAAMGSQDLSNYTFRQRDPVTGAVQREFTSNVSQSLLQFGCAVSLVDWVKVRLTFSKGTNTYASSSTTDEVFEAQNPRANENSIMHIELSKSF